MTHKSETISLWTVIVLYNPNVEFVNSLVERIHTVTNILLIDNSTTSVGIDVNDRLHIIKQSKNVGIAKAQNIGIQHALNAGADFILLLDQDSTIEPDQIITLKNESLNYENVVVTPVIVDSENLSEISPYKISRFGISNPVHVLHSGKNLQVTLCISSGMLVPAKVFNVVGLMNEDLFIDLVDFEWNFRCKYAGIRIIATPKCVMKHKIGVQCKSLLGFRSVVHSPIRTYYKTRNSLLFLRYSTIPLLFTIKQITSSIFHAVLQMLTCESKLENLKYFASGVIDGVFYRVERFD